MADTSDFITGCDGSEIPSYPPDECPPGTTWGCCPDEPEYPTQPPSAVSCITDNFSSYFRQVYKHRHDRTVYVSGGTNVQVYLLDENLDVILTIVTGTNIISGSASDGNYIYIALRYSLGSLGKLYKVHMDNLTIETININEYDLRFAFHISASNGYVCIAGNAIEVGGTNYDGGLILNTLGEYVNVIAGDNNSAEWECFIINGVVLHGRSDTGIPLKMYDPATGDYIADLPTFNGLTDPGYGNYMYDLGTDGDYGMFAILTGDYVSQNNGGFGSQYTSYINKVTLYDYNFNLIAHLTSPITTTTKSGFGSGVSRHGNFILIGEAYATAGNITGSGAVHMYSIDGTFVKTMDNWIVASAEIDAYYGNGVVLYENKYAAYGNYRDRRICNFYEPPVI